MAQKTQPSFTHPVKYGFTQLKKHRKTQVKLGFIKKQRNFQEKWYFRYKYVRNQLNELNLSYIIF